MLSRAWSQYFVIGNALDVFHDEEGAVVLGGPAVEDLGDVGMIHQGQRLPLGLESRENRSSSPSPP